jgi:heme/copper-type cytochrome/quinol oxidase subunit 1
LGVVNTGAVVALEWALRRRGDFGWYSYTPMPRRYADYLPSQHVVSGWAAIGVVAGVLVAVNVVIAVGYVLARRRTTTGPQV